MNYVMSDLHGSCPAGRFEDFLMDTLRLEKQDHLWVLGDVIDRGKHSLELLEYILFAPNTHLLLGNHEQMLLDALVSRRTPLYISQPAAGDEPEEALRLWFENGGESTYRSFLRRSKAEQHLLLRGLSSCFYYATVRLPRKTFHLVHANLILHGEPGAEYAYPYEMVWDRPDLQSIRFPNDADRPDDPNVIVVGHTPTYYLGDAYTGKIYTPNPHAFCVDVGTPLTGRLAALCLETMEELYMRI